MSAGVLLALALATAPVLATSPAPPVERPIAIEAQPLPLSLDQPLQARIGALTWAGGVRLTSRDASLGGLSGIAMLPDGVSFLSQSDAGWLFRGRLTLNAAGRLTGVADTTVQRLADEHGAPYARKVDADAEDVTLLSGGGFAISYEQDHRVMRYAAAGGAGERLAVSPDIARRPPNNGLEGLAYARGALFEGAEDGEIWRCELRPAADGLGACRSVMATTPFRGFSLTGLGPCGDGLIAVYRDVDVLHGWRAIIAWLHPQGDRLVAEPLAKLGRPLTRDNMEGISAVPLPADATHPAGWRLYLVSDDNYLKMQRTLLVAFDWRP